MNTPNGRPGAKGLSIGVLSWKAHETLRKTLASYEALLPLVDEAVVFFNSITPDDRAIAGEFGFRAEGSEENLGILGGTLSLARCLSGDKILLLQNDNPVNVSPDVLSRRIAEAIAILDEGKADMVRMRDRFDPSFSDCVKYLKLYPGEDGVDTLAMRMRRILRPIKARRMIGRAAAVLKDPSSRHPGEFVRCGESFITDSRYTNYSDQPFMASRTLALELLEWADARKEHSRTLNGRYVPEIIINSRFWRARRIRVAISEGVFAHARFDDSFRPNNVAFNPDIVTRQ